MSLVFRPSLVRRWAVSGLAAVAAVFSAGALAQSVSGLALDTTAALDAMSSTHASATDLRPAAREPQERTGMPGGEYALPPPIGASLFRGGFADDREDGLNPTYLVQPGDRVSVRVWGAVELDQVLTVDPQGNIFVPKVGPVAVGGVPNAALNQRVTNRVQTVFTDNVRVYTSLLGAQPVAVFVTGFVVRPGRYGGIPSNSALHFLDRAGGIDALRGSYRRVTIIRAGVEIAEFDLYDFLFDGRQPDVQFQDGDTIVVTPRGGAVVVTGDVAVDASVELLGQSISGRQLLESTQPETGVSHVSVSGIRAGTTFSAYLAIADFAEFSLLDGDRVHVLRDVHDKDIVVEVEGSVHLGPSRFVVPKDTRLQELLDHIEVDSALADIDAISIRRPSIAIQQKRSLEDSLRRLEARYLTASSATDAEARIRSQEAELIGNFVERARDVEPTGRLVVASAQGIADVRLQSGDVIAIPRQTDAVLLSGEVIVAQAMLWQQGQRARDYIKRAGGFTDQADRDRIVVVRANGEVETDGNPQVVPGDEIIALPRVTSKNLQIAATLVDILYKIAIAASVAIDL